MRGIIFPGEKVASSLLEAWQTTGDPEDFRRLWQATRSIVESVVHKTLYRQGIRDPAAADEAVSLVINHLRRLPSQGVANFDGNQTVAGYLCWLSSRRCRDVARSLRRRREVSLCGAWSQIAEPSGDPDVDYSEGESDGLADDLADAIRALDERSRLVIERHLAGEPQVLTAKALGVCGGTITRIRQRAIQRLRELLAETATSAPRPKPR